jgi:major vault protein
MTDDRRRERDLILAPNEHAFILDETKGNIINYVGPHKTSLANTDQPVVFNSRTKKFERCTLEQATQVFATAPEGWYLVLKNPAEDGKPARIGTANSLSDLKIGRKVNMPGPISFAPWPGQMVRVIQGHHLRSNQYLIVRVYDEEGARANWEKAVIKPQTTSTTEGAEVEETATTLKPDVEAPDLTMGKLLVIKGTNVSFYIPPTGIEVVPDHHHQFVREAITLERLEYCILLDEDGNKRYIKGPAVVFPRPTETFIEKKGSRKFKAIELNEISGLYVKVIAPYEENGQPYKVGDELFITGQDQMIYFPRPEHAMIRYGEQEVNHAVAIPAGEARYVMNRLTGQITLKKGPCMLLPDPRKEVIVRRVLTPSQVALWFPGNHEALEYNRRLMAITHQKKGEEFVREREARALLAEQVEQAASLPAATEEGFVGDEFTRHQQFTSPRTITLDTKYEGAVSINAWTGYAFQVVSKTGKRKVVVGPKAYLMEYDESLETMELSMGTPKTENKLFETVYLRVLHNKVSDIVRVLYAGSAPRRGWRPGAGRRRGATGGAQPRGAEHHGGPWLIQVDRNLDEELLGALLEHRHPALLAHQQHLVHIPGEHRLLGQHLLTHLQRRVDQGPGQLLHIPAGEGRVEVSGLAVGIHRGQGDAHPHLGLRGELNLGALRGTGHPVERRGVALVGGHSHSGGQRAHEPLHHPLVQLGAT